MMKLAHIADFLLIPFFLMTIIVAMRNMISEAYLTAVIYLPLMVLLIFLWSRYKNNNKIILIKHWLISHRKIVWITFQICSCLIMCVFIDKLRVNKSWDWGQLLTTASTYVLSGEWDKLEYFAQCSNNQPWLYCLIIFFRAIKRVDPSANDSLFQNAAIAMSFCFTQITLFLLYETARIRYKDEFKALLVGTAGLISLPFYLYAQFAYTDTVSMMLVIAALFLYLRMSETKKGTRLFLGILLSIISGLIFKIKVLAFIIVIALIINSFLKCTNWKKFFGSIIIWGGYFGQRIRCLLLRLIGRYQLRIVCYMKKNFRGLIM